MGYGEHEKMGFFMDGLVRLALQALLGSEDLPPEQVQPHLVSLVSQVSSMLKASVYFL